MSATCRSSELSRWLSVSTDDWVAAGSSENPAVSAGRPLGNSWRWTCCICLSRRSSRWSGVGGGTLRVRGGR